MSPLMILLLILILVIGCSNEIGGHRNVSYLDRINFVTFNVTKNQKDPSTLQRNHLRNDLQHLMTTMVKKIINKRRLKQSKWSNNRKNEKRIYDVRTGIENKLNIEDFPEENRLEPIEKSRRNDNYGKKIIRRRISDEISEQTSKDLWRISESLMPIIRRSLNSEIPKVRGYRDESARTRINSGNSSEIGRSSRVKRTAEKDVKETWMTRDFEGHETSMKMHAFVVRDEEIPPCCTPAKEVTTQRYFMCSGAILTLKHAITTASCMHYADIYENHVDADLAILVGATEPRAYVIKINRYEMHPEYDYDVDSKNHATNNVAILYLACSIVEQDVLVPSLPMGLNDDVAHMCCREGCDLITIVQSFDNRQIARIVQAKNLPAPRHDDDNVPNYRRLSNVPFESSRRFNKPMFANDTFPLSRRIRSPLKLAAAPIFFGKESRKSLRLKDSAKPVETQIAKKRNKLKTAQSSRVKNSQRGKKRKKPLNLNDLTNGRRTIAVQIPILRALQDEGVNVDEQLAAVDWEQIEESMSKKFTDANRETMNTFAKSVVDETMRRLESVVGDDGVGGTGPRGGPKGNGSVIFEKLMSPMDSRNKSIESFVKVFTKVVTSLVPPNNAAGISVPSDTSVEAKDLKDPPPQHEECPPLGSPIFIGETLIGLLAYTCDDVETWVEWKYVNVAKNMNWIRNRIAMEYEPPGTCGDTEKSPPLPPPLEQQQQQARSLPDATRPIDMDRKKFFEENSTDFRRDGKIEWPSREILDSRRHIVRNLDDARISVTEMSGRIPKDPWFARNSRLAPQQRSSNGDIPTIPQNVPKPFVVDTSVYNVNTCYVRADGTTDCQPGTNFNIR